MSVVMSDFGKDHWSMFAYAECCAVDGKQLEHCRMRINPDHHVSVGRVMLDSPTWEPPYGTRLKGFWKDDKTTDSTKQLPEHDDWDCVDDLEAAGLLDVGTYINPNVKLTDLGHKIASELRKHKASGGRFATFVSEVV